MKIPQCYKEMLPQKFDLPVKQRVGEAAEMGK